MVDKEPKPAADEPWKGKTIDEFLAETGVDPLGVSPSQSQSRQNVAPLANIPPVQRRPRSAAQQASRESAGSTRSPSNRYDEPDDGYDRRPHRSNSYETPQPPGFTTVNVNSGPERPKHSKLLPVSIFAGALILGGAFIMVEQPDLPGLNNAATHSKTSATPTQSISLTPSKLPSTSAKASASSSPSTPVVKNSFKPTATTCGPVEDVSLGQYGINIPETFQIKFPGEAKAVPIGDALHNYFPMTIQNTLDKSNNQQKAELMACVADAKVIKEIPNTNGIQTFNFDLGQIKYYLDTTHISYTIQRPASLAIAKCAIVEALSNAKAAETNKKLKPIDCTHPPTQYPTGYVSISDTELTTDATYLDKFLQEQNTIAGQYGMNALDNMLNAPQLKAQENADIPAVIENQIITEEKSQVGVDPSKVVLGYSGSLPDLKTVKTLPTTTVVDKGRNTQRTMKVADVFKLITAGVIAPIILQKKAN